MPAIPVYRLIDLKRRQRFQGSLPSQGYDDAPADEFDLLEGDSDPAPDDNLVNLLRDALIHAFGQCNPRDLMLMRLVSIYGVRQESIAHALGRRFYRYQSSAGRRCGHRPVGAAR